MKFSRRGFLGMIGSVPVAAIGLKSFAVKNDPSVAFGIGLLDKDGNRVAEAIPKDLTAADVTFSGIAEGMCLRSLVLYDAVTGETIATRDLDHGSIVVPNGGDISVQFKGGMIQFVD